MAIPNLFIVGQPKSGTTALAQALSQHPEIFMSHYKEPHHFCSDLQQESQKYHRGAWKYYELCSRKRYLSLFETNQNYKYYGEASTNYLFSSTSAKEIFDFNPEAKIIMIFREPADFLHSLHKEYSTSLNEDQKDFEKALKLEPSRALGQNIPRYAAAPSLVYYSKRVQYAEQLERYLRWFPSSNILVLFYEIYKNDNLATYQRITNHLGIDPEIIPDFKTLRSSRAPRNERLNAIARNPMIKGIIKNLLPPKIYFSLQKKIQSMLLKEDKKEPCPERIKSQLKEKHASEVRALTELMDKHGITHPDLFALWGY